MEFETVNNSYFKARGVLYEYSVGSNFVRIGNAVMIPKDELLELAKAIIYRASVPGICDIYALGFQTLEENPADVVIPDILQSETQRTEK